MAARKTATPAPVEVVEEVAQEAPVEETPAVEVAQEAPASDEVNPFAEVIEEPAAVISFADPVGDIGEPAEEEPDAEAPEGSLFYVPTGPVVSVDEESGVITIQY